MYGLGADTEPGFKADVQKWARPNGVTVKFTKAASWDTEIRARVAGGNPPDVGLFPQPGLMCDLAKQKKLIAFDDATVTTDKADAGPGLRRGRNVCGRQGLRPAERGQRQERPVDGRPGLQGGRLHPAEDARRDAHLTDQIKAAGKTPWCIAAESGAATGWPITDWIEDLVLRLAGPDNYDKWVTGALKFNSPEIKPAFEYFQKIAFTDANVRGGTKSIVATNFQTGGNALFDNPPGCYLFKQATFVANKGGFPDAVHRQAGHRDPAVRVPAEGRGRQLGAQSLATSPPRSTTTPTRSSCATSSPARRTAPSRPRHGSFSPHTTADVSLLPEQDAPDDRHARCSTRPRPRGSTGPTSMPAKVGAGTFWTEPVKWISGQQDLDTTLNNIDASFPKASS